MPFRKFMLIASAGLAMVAIGCGEKAKEKSDDIAIDIEPPEPIVITADTSEKTAPWFSFKVKVTNNSNAVLHLVAATVDMKIKESTGNTLQATGAFAPSDLDAEVSDDDRTCAFEDFDEYNPGDSFYLQATNTSDDPDCPTSPIEITFTAENAPNSENLSSYRYNVKLTPSGYFINDDGTLERYENFKLFTTK